MYFVVGGDVVRGLRGDKLIYTRFGDGWPHACVDWVCLQDATPFDTREEAHRFAHLASSWAEHCQIKIVEIHSLNYNPKFPKPENYKENVRVSNGTVKPLWGVAK